MDIAAGRPQKMKIMTPVWMLTGLWANLAALYAYFKIGRTGREMSPLQNPTPGKDVKNMDMPMDMGAKKPLWQGVVLSTLHCGAGCTLADIAGEWFTFFIPLSAWGSPLIGQWIFDYILALAFGGAFQYAAIRPMEKELSTARAAVKALKVDFLSLTAWQTGMYGCMAVVMFVFNNGMMMPKTDWQFWFMMQIGMFCGFATAYPVNWFLVKNGIKKAM